MNTYPKNTLKVQNLAFARNDIYLFQDLNVELSSSELLQIRGRNGSGKSTLLRILAGFIEPLAGKIEGFIRENIHYVGHQNGLKPNLTVYENLKLTNTLLMNNADIEKIAEKTRIKPLLHTYARDLSAGLCRRVSLSRLLLTPRPVWILDEPMTALDLSSQEFLMELFTEHLQNQGMIVMATHHHLSLKNPLKVIHLGECDK